MRVLRRILTLTLISTLAASTLWGAETKQADVAKPEKKPGVVAIVNGSEIPLDDFYRELLRAERLVLSANRLLTSPQIATLRKEVAEGLVRRELLYQESKKSVKVTDAEIDAEMKKLKDQYPSESDFRAALGTTNVSLASLKAQVERAVSIQKMIDQFASKATVDDKEIWAYYDKNRASFRQPEQVKASQILIKTDPAWDEAKKSAARKKIDDIKSKVKQGQDFESLARTYSEDPTGAKGGDWATSGPARFSSPSKMPFLPLSPGKQARW